MSHIPSREDAEAGSGETELAPAGLAARSNGASNGWVAREDSRQTGGAPSERRGPTGRA
jgi:hypothetical protein